MKSVFRLILTLCFCFSQGIDSSGQPGHTTNNEEVRVVFDSAGIHTYQNDFDRANLFKKTSWSGDWIWLNKSVFSRYQKTRAEWIKSRGYSKQYRALFRKNFHLSQVPAEAVLYITADVSYRLYINGVFVDQGPANIGSDYLDTVPPTHWFYNALDVSRYLQPGNNLIAVEVFSHFREISETTSGKGMLICDLDTLPGKTLFGTDNTWQCSLDTSFYKSGSKFSKNANYEPAGWNEKSFDDRLWENSGVIEFPKEGYLINSEIPVPIRYAVLPKEIWFTEPGATAIKYDSLVSDMPYHKTGFMMDYGKNLTGYYGFEVIAHLNDTVRIFPSEKINASQNRSLIYVCKEGRNVFEAPYLSVYRYLKAEILSEKGLVLEDIHTDFSSYPVNYQGSFACSDSALTRLWDITRWTTQLCMNDMFYDSPKHQEPNACTGDYLIQSLINYYAFGDPLLTRQTLIKTALMLEKNKYDMFHTSYSLLWIQMINNYYLYTGDTTLVRTLLPHINKLIDLFKTYMDSDFLVSNAPDYMFMDWIKIDKYNAHHPPAVIGMGYMTAFYYKALIDAAFLNSLMKSADIAKEDLSIAGKIKKSFNRLLWDNDRKIYRDGIPFRSKAPNYNFFPEDTDIVTYSPHVNTLAVLYNIAPKEYNSAIMDYVINQKSIDLQPYFMFFVLSAAEHIGQFSETGLDLLGKWEKGFDKETYTLKENWQDVTETGYGGDYSHAWGGSPLYFMSKNILGIKPGKGGYNEIEIDPLLSSKISWAKGTVPISGGNCISVSWTNEPGSDYILNLDIPKGRTGFLNIPIEFRQRDYLINKISYSKKINRIKLDPEHYEIVFKR